MTKFFDQFSLKSTPKIPTLLRKLILPVALCVLLKGDFFQTEFTTIGVGLKGDNQAIEISLESQDKVFMQIDAHSQRLNNVKVKNLDEYIKYRKECLKLNELIKRWQDLSPDLSQEIQLTESQAQEILDRQVVIQLYKLLSVLPDLIKENHQSFRQVLSEINSNPDKLPNIALQYSTNTALLSSIILEVLQTYPELQDLSARYYNLPDPISEEQDKEIRSFAGIVRQNAEFLDAFKNKNQKRLVGSEV